MAVDDYAFALSAGEKMSPLWIRLAKQLEFLLETQRKRLENPQDQSKSDVLRGEIKCLRSILAFGADPAPILDAGGETETPQRRRR